MAHTVLSAKSGNDWTRIEVNALNIVVQELDAPAFFGDEVLPEPTVDAILLDNLACPDGPMSKEHRLFFRYLEDASHFLESSTIDFTAFLLGILDFDEPGRVIHQRLEIGFFMCGQVANAKPDAVIIDEKEDYILLVQEDKMSLEEVEPQLIAGAIAAFYESNRRRTAAGLPTLFNKVFAGIAMSGTGPTFYKIPISQELLDRIGTAQLFSDAEDSARMEWCLWLTGALSFSAWRPLSSLWTRFQEQRNDILVEEAGLENLCLFKSLAKSEKVAAAVQITSHLSA